MKTLFPKQVEAKDFFLQVQQTNRNTLDTSDAGTGKTVVAAHLIRELGCPVAVLCPKSVIPSWERELADAGVEPLFVMNFEKIRGGRTKWMSKRGKKIMKWNIPPETLILCDEIHKCKGPYTLNAQLVISLQGQGFSIHGMSATAAEDPTEMRALGYMLELHNLNRSLREQGTITQPSWTTWMTRHGCGQNFWGQWELNKRSTLKTVRETMYGNNTCRLSVDDLPEAFKENRIFIEPIQFKDSAKIKRAYKELGITPEIVEEYIVEGKITEGDHILTNILRARQLAEGLKAPDIAEMAEDLMLEGLSVVIFVNFRDTVEALCQRLQCDRVEGSQKTDRQQAIDDFTSDKTNCIVVNTTAGGTGVSLHDMHGNRPRVSLISPAFSAKDYVQVLGRIHRNGMKSNAMQKVLVANGSVEEHVMASMQRRLENLRTMQNN
tara:strand:+ start:5266 stop:6573 length:1308 start_codon:yes stop_codon:yes gene_type:complete